MANISNVKIIVLWRTCNFTPIHGLPSLVGQLFASRLGGQRFASWGCTISQWNRVSPVSTVSLHWWPQSLASRPSLGASQGFTPSMRGANLIAHHVPSLVPFHSLQVLILATQWPVRALVNLLGGALWKLYNFTPIHSPTGPVSQLFASHQGGQRFASWGCINSQWSRVNSY